MIETLCAWKLQVDSALHQVFDPLHFSGMGNYWHVMLASYIAVCLVKRGLHIMSQVFLPRIYGRLDDKTKRDWDIASIGLLHSLYDSSIILWYLVDGTLAKNRMDGYDKTFEFLLATMQGYYIWDLIVCLTNFSEYGFPYLIHGGLGVLGLLIVTSGQLQFYAIPYLLPELSSVFLNIRHLLKYSGMSGTLAYKVNFAVFTGAFIVIRLGYEAYQAYVLAVDVYHGQTGSAYRPFAVYFTVVGATLTFLNVMWLREILKAAYYTLGKPAKAAKTAKKTQ